MNDEQYFTATWSLGNSAMMTTADIASQLRDLAARVEYLAPSGYFETIVDDNGNDIGRFKIGYKDRVGVDLQQWLKEEA